MIFVLTGARAGSERLVSQIVESWTSHSFLPVDAGTNVSRGLCGVLALQTVFRMWCPSASVGSEGVLSGTLLASLVEDVEPARTALSCHLSMDLLCQETEVLKWLFFTSALFLGLKREDIFLPTPGLQVLHRVSTVGSVVINAMLPRRNCLREQ